MNRTARRFVRRRTDRTDGESTETPVNAEHTDLAGVAVVGLALLSSAPSEAAVGFAAASVLCATIVTGGGAAIAEAVRCRASDHSHSVGASADPPRGADPAVVALVERPFLTPEETRRRLRALERLFRDRGDRRAVFLTVYARVTEEVAEAVARGAFDDPRWVAAYLVGFANFYRRAVLDFETGRETSVPTAWRLAFRAAGREEASVLQHAALGVNAHVSFDLAFALLAVGVADGRPAKYRDHHRINLVLWRLVDVTLDRLAERYAPGIATLVDAVGPLVKLCWFGALVVGRECAWWAAVVLTESRRALPARATRWVVAAASASVARAVLWPTAHPVSARALRALARRLGVGRL